MKKIILHTALTVVLTYLVSCVSTSNNGGVSSGLGQVAPDTIPYTVAQHYFVRNDVDSVPTIINSQAELEKYFGMAAYMGPNGEPTKIDFSQNSVLAVVLPVTDLATEIIPESFVRESNGDAVFSCEVKTGEKQSYSTRPMLTAIVNKQEASNPKFQINYAPYILLVYYDKASGDEALKSEIKSLGGEIVYDYKNINGLAAKFGGSISPQQAIDNLSKTQGVLSVQPDSKAELQ